ncbi:MAG: hypothetical protein IPF92_27115 [Myxococcales bacterium]|nr:hypothetical protein [Myxococcales bacterium]
MRMKNGILAIALGSLVSAGALVAGCSDDAPMKADAGTVPTTTTTATSSTPTTTLYERLGKLDGIKTAVKAIVVEELKDANIRSYFYFQLNATPGRPTPAQIEECLSNQLAKIAGGPEQYPLTVAGGFVCRSDMKAVHADLRIPGATFDKFIEIAGGVLTAAKVAPADIKAVADALVATKGAVVDPAASGDFKPPTDAGGGG